MRIVSLCSGIAGLDLGVKLAVPSATVVAYVEREAAAIEILAARMEDGSLAPAPIFFDFAGAQTALLLAGGIDLVTAGYPCQPFSLAGKGAGFDDERDIWPLVRGCHLRATTAVRLPGKCRSSR